MTYMQCEKKTQKYKHINTSVSFCSYIQQIKWWWYWLRSTEDV